MNKYLLNLRRRRQKLLNVIYGNTKGDEFMAERDESGGSVLSQYLACCEMMPSVMAKANDGYWQSLVFVEGK